jgi:hypothetical protein
MRISLPDAAKPLVAKQMAKAGYDDAGEYVMSLIERDERRSFQEEVEQMLLEAVDSPSIPWTPQLKEEILRLGRKMNTKRKGREAARRS